MNSQLTTSMSSPASRRRSSKRFGLVVNLFALCALLFGMGPLASWATEPVNINLASAEVLAEALRGSVWPRRTALSSIGKRTVRLSMRTSWQRFRGSDSLLSRKIAVLFDSSSSAGSPAP